MDSRYLAYCLADPDFYDTPTRSGEPFAAAERSVPDGWSSFTNTAWLVLHPHGAALPAQGWKIHVSACLSNAEEVIEAVWAYCVPRRLPFKFLPDRHTMLASNSKYAFRGSSGKLVTIYPSDVGELARTLVELGVLLDGQPGPYILSDLRWRSGPLYVRYGSFVERDCRTDDGRMVPAIEDPDGRLVPDLRQPTFHVPDWVTIPDCLAEPVAARQADVPEEFPYRIERRLHYSNGGGVYLAKDERTGRTVVLKEARPHAGLDGLGIDAVDRLQRERQTLERLAGLGCVPEVIEYRTWWEHHFLVQEWIEGDTLNGLMARRYPLVRHEPTAEQLSAYTDWAIGVLTEVERALDAIHAQGMVYGDLHPSNIMVRPDGSIALVDFELATPVDVAVRPALGAPGYAAPLDRTGVAIDRYALGCVRLSMFLPLTQLLSRDPAKIGDYLTAVCRRFPVPATFAAQTMADLGIGAPVGPLAGYGRASWHWAAEREPATLAWAPLRTALAGTIVSSATVDRADRLFPGDIDQFTYGGLGLAHGAAGVLWALHSVGAGRTPELEQWLLDGVRRSTRHRPGFYDGLHGVAYALQGLGRTGDALEVLDRALCGPVDDEDVSLFSGAAGIGLNLLAFAELTDDPGLWLAAEAVTAQAAARLAGDTGACAGLMHGWSGPALLFIRGYEATGDERLLDHAAAALRRDLARCVWCEDGSLQTDEGRRVLPYIATGSAGIGLVLAEYLGHRHEEEFAEAQAGIRRAAESEFFVFSGLFNGRAGLITYLRHLERSSGEVQPALARHLHGLGLHAMPHGAGVAFPGDQLLRMSMDLATGTAGVLLALGAVLSDGDVGLPFLGPRRLRSTRVPIPHRTSRGGENNGISS